ncbi:hypothetical protein [Deinococcus pimensis]|uniref:hypothetical protein n=1 Tax=Deinococcus pimensis TaxID=309888 RepID=UPI000483A02E|nr:hypothetical protein [Deinococcus pimensis]
MTTYVDPSGRTVQLGRELGVGGQGAVYTVPNDAGVVAKIYLQPPDARATRKLDALVRAADPQLQSVSAWPQTLLRDPKGGVRGFLMPLVPSAEYHELHMLYRPGARKQHFPKADWRFLVHVARNVARAFAVLHARGHLMGDVSARNVMVSHQGVVRFIDTDSFQVQVGTEVFTCPVGTAEFTPPELQGKGFGTLVRDMNHDLFGLALLVFHLLFEGRHPYAGVHADGGTPSPAEAIAKDLFAYSLQRQAGVTPPPFTLTLKGLPEGLRTLFERAFAPTHAGRPTAVQWEAALAELFTHITTCAKNAAHQHDRRVSCPWCASLPSNAGAATAKTGVPGSAKRIDVEAELNRIWRTVQAVPVPTAPTQVPVTVRPAPLPLPALPPLDTPRSAFQVSSVLWGITNVVLALLSVQTGVWWLTLILVGFAWYSFSRNSAPVREKRRVAQLDQLKQRQHQTYAALLRQSLTQYQGEAQTLRQQLDQASRRLDAVGAPSKYRQAIHALEGLRTQLRLLELEEERQVRALLERHRKSALDVFLSKFVIAPGTVNGIGASLVATLHASGIRTAKDVTSNVRWVKGVGPKRQQDLQDWRETLEQFFQFDPAQVPRHEVEAVRARVEQQRAAQLRQLEGAVAQFVRDVLAWRQAEQTALQEIHALKVELAQREKTIDVIQSSPLALN